jgi:hypothetical protein
MKDEEQKIKVISTKITKYQQIQKYLLKQGKLCTFVPVNIHNQEETVDLLHDIVLEKIESWYKQNVTD